MAKTKPKVKKEATGFIVACDQVMKMLTSPNSLNDDQAVTIAGSDLKEAMRNIREGKVDVEDSDCLYEVTVKRVGKVSFGVQLDEPEA